MVQSIKRRNAGERYLGCVVVELMPKVFYVLLLFFSSYFFCGFLSAAETGTLTVRFGQTTEDTFKASHPDAVNLGFNKNLKGTIYQKSSKISPKDFYFDGMDSVFTLFDQSKNLIAIYIQFEGDYSAIAGGFLIKKYKLIINKNPIIGTSYMELYNKGVDIYMKTPFLSSTSVFYITTSEKDKLLKDIPENMLGNENEILDFLVEKCFPKAMR